MAELNVNGKKYKIDVDPTTPLMWVITVPLNNSGF